MLSTILFLVEKILSPVSGTYAVDFGDGGIGLLAVYNIMVGDSGMN